MFPFSLPVLVKEKTELVDFDALETLFANANDVFYVIYFWLCRNRFVGAS